MFLCYQQELISVYLQLFPTTVVLSDDFSVFVSLTKTEKLSLEDQFSKKKVMCMYLCYQQVLISVHLHLYSTTVVLSGDFFRFREANKNGKTVIRRPVFQKIVMCMYLCYQQVLIRAHLHLYPTTVVLSGDFSVFVRLTKTENLSLEDQFSKKKLCVCIRVTSRCS